MAKVVLDAGHGGSNPGAVYRGREEKTDALNLTLAVGEILEDHGVDVVFTRTEDITQSPGQKARIANEEDADYFVSIHRNSSPRENQYEGVETLVYDDSGVKAQMARNINRNMSELGFRNIGVTPRPNLIVLNSTQMPAVLVEAGFINTDKDNELFDTQFDRMAQAIADGILETIQPQQVETPPYYRVQVGLFRNRNNAETLLYRLQLEGYPAYMVYEDGFYVVQVGTFTDLDNAVKMEARLRAAGYSTLVTKK